MFKNENTIPKPKEQYPEPLLDMLAQDDPRSLEIMAITLPEHEAARTDFLTVKDKFIEQYKKVVGFYGNTSWNELNTWAFDPEKLYEIATLERSGKLTRSRAYEISDLALNTLLAHRSLAQSFSYLTEEDKKSLRPKEIRFVWQNRDQFEERVVDISRLIEAEAANRYLLLNFSDSYSVEYAMKHFYNDQMQQIIDIRESLIEAQVSIHTAWYQASCSGKGKERERAEFERPFRNLCGHARDNGDDVFWKIASKCLDPYIINDLYRPSNDLYRPSRSEPPTPKLYLAEQIMR